MKDKTWMYTESCRRFVEREMYLPWTITANNSLKICNEISKLCQSWLSSDGFIHKIKKGMLENIFMSNIY